MVTTILEILGVSCIAGFAWFVWPPLVLFVIGIGLLTGCWAVSR